MKAHALVLLFPMIAFSCNSPTTYAEPIDCGFLDGFADTSALHCGVLKVPEDHDRPLGKQITITYLLIKSTHEKPNPYPLIYFSGGPGGASLNSGRIRSWMRHPVRATHDIIMFDQRGIGYSTAIPNMEKELFELMAKDATETHEQEMMDALIAKYKNICEEREIDLTSYNSFQNARDVGMLMEHLGYQKYNLYGVSYGTRLGRIVQDMFPEYLNSVIHNSPAPLGGDFLIGRLNSYSLALGRVFDYCRNDPRCNSQYPDLREMYLHGIETLQKKPMKTTIRGTPFYINAQDAVYLLRRKLYGNDSRSQIPVLVRAFRDRGGNIIQDIIESELLFSGSYNSTMWMAVERYEMFDPRFRDRNAVEKEYEKLPLLPVNLGIFTSIYHASYKLHEAKLPEGDKQFKMSSVPSLIMVNQYDPVTPPENGYVFQAQLPNSHLFVLDEGGHGGGNTVCRSEVMVRFMEAPEEDLDSGCLNIYQPK